MWLLPIACTGWFSVFVWTIIQIVLLFRDEKCMQEVERKVRIDNAKRKEAEKEEIQRQIKIAKMAGYNYAIRNGKVIFIGKKRY